MSLSFCRVLRGDRMFHEFFQMMLLCLGVAGVCFV